MIGGERPGAKLRRAAGVGSRVRLLLLAVLALLLAAPATTLAQDGATGPTGPVNPLPPAASTTSGAADETETAATVAGRIIDANGGETRVQFEYGTTTSYGLLSPVQVFPATTRDTEVRARLERLTPSTTYHFRVVATNDAGVTRGADQTFRTTSPPARPGVGSDPAADVTLDAATLQARVDPNRQATSYLFEYGTSPRYGTGPPAADAGAGDAAVRVSARIAGLRPNTTYNFRLRATNAIGTTTGGNRTFRTGKLPLTLQATASPTIVRYTRTLTVTGTVTGTDNRGVPITLQRRNFPFDTDFRTFGVAQQTDSSGVVRFLVPPFTLASQFRLISPERGNLTSNVATVAVRASVTLRARRLSGGRVRFFGAVTPGNAAGTVSVQRRTADGRYIPVRRVRLRTAGGVARFSVTTLRRGATTTYRAATRLSVPSLVDGRSPVIRLTGRR